jgi:hypothetical protein
MALPVLNFFTSTGVTVGSVDFGTISSGQESDNLNLEVWNNKGGTVAVDTARNVAITVRNSTAPTGEDPVSGGWIRGRSSGILNPTGQADFRDDAQADLRVIDFTNNLEIGDIPNNSGRKLVFKLVVPNEASAQSQSQFRIIAGFRPLSNPLPFFHNRTFGDGVVEDVVPQIFPAVLEQKNGTWTDLIVRTSGAYTGDSAKQYIVTITGGCLSGIAIGGATYATSDDGGVTFGPALTTSSIAPTNVLTSAGVDEGVDIRFSSLLGATLVDGDSWHIDVDLDPFALKAGVSTSLQGFVGFGEALVFNNRVRHQSVTTLSGLTESNRTYVFIAANGAIDSSVVGNPRAGRLKLGSFLTDSQKVISSEKFALPVTLGTDAFDDFSPILQELDGLTWSFNRGKFRKFNEVIRVPSTSSFPIGTISLFGGTINYIQIDPINETVVTKTGGYNFDHIPLFQVLTGLTFMESIQDDRTNIGVTSLDRTLIQTLSTISTGTTASFSFPDFGVRAIVKKTIFTPSPIGASGYTVSIFGDSAEANLQYQAGTLTGLFTDNFTWFFSNSDNPKTRTIYGGALNQTGVTLDFLTLQIDYEQLH